MSGEGLRVLSGGAEGVEIALTGDFTIGRSETGLGNLGADAEISRQHARVRRGEDGWWLIEDLGSTNGTFVNGSRIAEPRRLANGDEIEVGKTKLRFEMPEPTLPARETVADANATVADADAAVADAGATVVEPRAPAPPRAEPPPPRAQPAPPRAAPIAPRAEPPAPPAEPAPGQFGFPAFQPPPGEPRPARRTVPLAVMLGALGALLVAAVVVVILVNNGKSSPAPARTTASAVASVVGGPSTAPSNCGAKIGSDGAVADIAYVESNALHGHNSVIAIPYHVGDMKPLAMSQCPTGGSGSADLTDSGVLDADQEVLVNATHTLLFAVNQGSDTIAVFHIAASGALSPVAGSPFPSGGKGPASLGLNTTAVGGSTLVVANKAQDGIRDLTNVSPNYTSFTVGAEGQLTPVSGSNIVAAPGSSPTDAYVPPQGGVAFSTEESGPIRAFSIAASGALAEAPGSPYQPPSQLYPPGFDPAKRFALGITAFPKAPVVYISMTTIPALAVYTFTPTGALTIQSAVPVAGAYLPCWLVITPNGHFLFTSNADTDNVTVFDLDNPLRPKQIQTLPFKTPGNPWQEAIDPTGHFLFVNTPRDTLKTPPGTGNTQHVMQIGAEGQLTELNATSPTKIPVPDGANPQGIAIVPGPGTA